MGLRGLNEASRSHARTYVYNHANTHKIGLPWTSDQFVAEAITYATHNKHNRRITMFYAGFEPGIRVIEPLQTHALDRKATEIDIFILIERVICI